MQNFTEILVDKCENHFFLVKCTYLNLCQNLVTNFLKHGGLILFKIIGMLLFMSTDWEPLLGKKTHLENSLHKNDFFHFERIIELQASDIVGQSTFGMKGSKSMRNETKVELLIRQTSDVVKLLTSETGWLYFVQNFLKCFLT